MRHCIGNMKVAPATVATVAKRTSDGRILVFFYRLLLTNCNNSMCIQQQHVLFATVVRWLCAHNCDLFFAATTATTITTAIGIVSGTSANFQVLISWMWEKDELQPYRWCYNAAPTTTMCKCYSYQLSQATECATTKRRLLPLSSSYSFGLWFGVTFDAFCCCCCCCCSL